MRSLIAIVCLLPMLAWSQAIQRQFFTTNTAPIVEVVAGSNATVQFSTPNTQTRRYTVNGMPGGGSGQTNLSVVAAGTNVVVVTNTAGGVSAYTVHGLTDTNLVNSIASSNAEYQAGLATNGLSSANSNIFVLKAGDTVSGPILTTSSTSNSPSPTELATAGWVRGLFSNGVLDYVTTNIDINATNPASYDQVIYKFSTVIPQPATRIWATAFLTNNGYVGSVVTTNTFTFLQGPILINSYLGMTGGGAVAMTVHPEIYYSYDKTNWYGDWEAQGQALQNNRTNLYQWVISIPAVSATNTTGFYIQRRFKINSVSSTPTLYVMIGTNLSSGTQDASHISLNGVSSAISGFIPTLNGTGTNTILVGSVGYTNWTWTDTNGWHNTNNVAASQGVNIVRGNVIADQNIMTANGQFVGNGGMLTNVPGTLPSMAGRFGAWVYSTGSTPVYFTPRELAWMYTDWLDASGSYTPPGWSSNGSGAGSGIGYQASLAGRPGIVKLKTGTDATGKDYTYTGLGTGSHVIFGSGLFYWEFCVSLSALSDNTDNYTFYCGISDQVGAFGNGVGTGVWFEYSNNTNSGNFLCKQRLSSGTIYSADTGLAVGASPTWYVLGALIAADGTSVSYYTNGVLAATIAQSVAAGTAARPHVGINKAAGTTDRDAYADYFWMIQNFTTTR